MKKLLLLPIFVFLISFSLFAKGVTISVELSPAGSFEAKAKSVKGTVKVNGNSVSGSNLYVKTKSLKTGMDLRDEHLIKKLEYKKHSKIIAKKIVGKNGKGTALFSIRGIEGKVPFTYSKVDSKYMKANFTISLKAFKIEGVSYMGAGVKDKIKLEAYVKYK
ncbi:MAG: polyisoprenoid-binding protein YceI [Bacteriovoracaceae bacterium]|jgi:polyisoprenoid-binding protein YceI